MTERKEPAQGYRSLQRGLQVLTLVQEQGRVRISEIGSQLSMPLSTVYRYVNALDNSGFAHENDGYLVAGERLAETTPDSPHLVQMAAPVLRRLRRETGLTAVLAVRVHITAVCLDVSYAHPQHRVSFGRGQIRSLYAGASALALLAYAPQKVVRELLSGDLHSYTTATLTQEMLDPYLRQVRAEGHAVSYGQITPGMMGVGVPVLVGGECLCSLSLIGEQQHLADSVGSAVEALRAGAKELVESLPSNTENDVWMGDHE